VANPIGIIEENGLHTGLIRGRSIEGHVKGVEGTKGEERVSSRRRTGLSIKKRATGHREGQRRARGRRKKIGSDKRIEVDAAWLKLSPWSAELAVGEKSSKKK